VPNQTGVNSTDGNIFDECLQSHAENSIALLFGLAIMQATNHLCTPLFNCCLRKGLPHLTAPSLATSQKPRSVWLVLFDPLPAVITESTDPASAAFDLLEASGIVFEQYVVQDVRSVATLDDYLGGAAAIRNWCRAAGVLRGSVVWLQVSAEVSCSVGVFSAPELLAATQAEVVQLSVRDLLQPAAGLMRAVETAGLVIVSVRLSSDAVPATAAEVVTQLQSLAAGLCGNSRGAEPVWLVTGFRGVPRPPEAPLESGADEAFLHVPLWVTAAESAGTRLQTLCGSFDLLPTVGELLSPGCAAAGETAAADGPVNLLAGEYQRFDHTPRLLQLQHDMWTGRRTSQYFLVQPVSVRGEASCVEGVGAEPGSDDLPEPRLYLKPDDYWNINNSIVAYREIAEQMALAGSAMNS
jgi:hypothetical protein